MNHKLTPEQQARLIRIVYRMPFTNRLGGQYQVSTERLLKAFGVPFLTDNQFAHLQRIVGRHGYILQDMGTDIAVYNITHLRRSKRILNETISEYINSDDTYDPWDVYSYLFDNYIPENKRAILSYSQQRTILKYKGVFTADFIIDLRQELSRYGYHLIDLGDFHVIFREGLLIKLRKTPQKALDDALITTLDSYEDDEDEDEDGEDEE